MTRLIRPLTMIATSSATDVATAMFCSISRMARTMDGPPINMAGQLVVTFCQVTS